MNCSAVVSEKVPDGWDACPAADTKCKSADKQIMTDMQTKCGAEKDQAKANKCRADEAAALSADCTVCMGTQGDAAMAKCFPGACARCAPPSMLARASNMTMWHSRLLLGVALAVMSVAVAEGEIAKPRS